MLHGLVIAVTGATAGIGAATASLCAARGANVIVTGRNAERGNAVCREILKAGGSAAFCLSDVTANDSGETTVAAALTHFGRLDALVNNAGILVRGDALSCSDAEWDLVMATNATAVFRHSRAAVRQMQRQGTGGAIVNIASDWGLVGAEAAVAYAASKGAVVQLTRSMALDHARDGIRVNAVCPGDTDTAMLAQDASPGDRARHIAQLAAALPLGRVATPRDVAAAAAFLLSPDAALITGICLPVDAGNTAR
jgi:meso-butanediol dehydrogenase/(S,S)-butanediol dehydrogenase/diacetyl reductase